MNLCQEHLRNGSGFVKTVAMQASALRPTAL